MAVNRITDIITIVDGVCGGRPVIRGTRIEPRHLETYAARGDVNGAAGDYPSLTREQILAAFEYLTK
jgi:uncharacterized protein (DUF433 family)